MGGLGRPQSKFGHWPNSVIADNMSVFDFYIFNPFFFFLRLCLFERFSCCRLDWPGITIFDFKHRQTENVKGEVCFKFILLFYLKRQHLCVCTDKIKYFNKTSRNKLFNSKTYPNPTATKQNLYHSLQNQTRGRQRVGIEKKGRSRSLARFPSIAQQISVTTRPAQWYHRNIAIARRSSVYADTTRSQTNITIPHGGVECLHYASNEGNHETELIDRSTITKCYTFVYALHSRKWTRSQSSRWDILLTFRQTRGFTMMWIFSLRYTGCSAGNNSIDTSTAV